MELGCIRYHGVANGHTGQRTLSISNDTFCASSLFSSALSIRTICTMYHENAGREPRQAAKLDRQKLRMTQAAILVAAHACIIPFATLAIENPPPPTLLPCMFVCVTTTRFGSLAFDVDYLQGQCGSGGTVREESLACINQSPANLGQPNMCRAGLSDIDMGVGVERFDAEELLPVLALPSQLAVWISQQFWMSRNKK